MGEGVDPAVVFVAGVALAAFEVGEGARAEGGGGAEDREEALVEDIDDAVEVEVEVAADVVLGAVAAAEGDEVLIVDVRIAVAVAVAEGEPEGHAEGGEAGPLGLERDAGRGDEPHDIAAPVLAVVEAFLTRAVHGGWKGGNCVIAIHHGL